VNRSPVWWWIKKRWSQPAGDFSSSPGSSATELLSVLSHCWLANRNDVCPVKKAVPLLAKEFRGVSTGRNRGTCPPRFQAEGTVMQTSPTLLTHNNVIAGFTSRSLGLPAYTCKTGSSTAIKLAPRMHQNLPFWAQKSNKKILPLVGRGQPFPTFHPLGALGASFLALAMFRPPLFKQWIRPCQSLCSRTGGRRKPK